MQSLDPLIDKIDAEIRITDTIKKRNTVRKKKPLTDIVNTLKDKDSPSTDQSTESKDTFIPPEKPTIEKKKRKVVWLQ